MINNFSFHFFFPLFFFTVKYSITRYTHVFQYLSPPTRRRLYPSRLHIELQSCSFFFLFFRSDSNFDLFTTQRCTCKLDCDWLPREIDTYLSSPSQPLLVIETGTKQSTKCPGTLLFFFFPPPSQMCKCKGFSVFSIT